MANGIVTCPHCGAPIILNGKGYGLCEYCGAQINLNDEVTPFGQTEAEYYGVTDRNSPDLDAPRRRPWVLWVLGFLFIFPLPVTILVVRSCLPKWARVLIIIAAWTVYFLWGYSAVRR